MTLAEVDSTTWAAVAMAAVAALGPVFLALAAWLRAKARAIEAEHQRDVLSEGIEAANGSAAPVRAALSERLADDPATKAALDRVREKSTAKIAREKPEGA